jgi:hypothetical protein
MHDLQARLSDETPQPTDRCRVPAASFSTKQSPLAHGQWQPMNPKVMHSIEFALRCVVAGRDDDFFAGQSAIDFPEPARTSAGTGRKIFADK